MNIFIKFWVRDNVHELVVDLYQGNLHLNPIILNQEFLLPRDRLFQSDRSASWINFEEIEIFEVCPTFYHDCVFNLFMNNQMVMPSQDQVDLRNCLCEFLVVVFHHVGQGDQYIASILSFKDFDHGLSKLNKIDVLTKIVVNRIKGVNPFFFS